MGIQLGAQCRAGLLLGCRDMQEQVPGAAAKSLERGQQRKPRPALTHPSPRPGCLLLPLAPSDPTHCILQVLAAAFGGTSGTELGKGPCNANICFLHPSHHFYLLLPFKAPSMLQVLPALVFPRHSLGSDTFWVSELPPCEY